MTLVLPYPPSANDYWRTVQGRTYVTHKARSYRDAVRMKLLTTGLQRLDGEVAVTVRVYRPARRGDLDNVLKILLDSLKGHAFVDDSQVVDIHARRFDDKANPRAEVTIAAVTHG